MDEDDDIYELELDDPDLDPDAPGGGRRDLPPASFRERLRTLKPSRTLLPSRSTARLLVIGLLAAALSAGTAATATTWYDTAARHDREADVVQLVMTALTDDDPSLSKLDRTTGIATEQYVLEFANNGPVPVTVTSAAVTPGVSATNAFSQAWKPLGPTTVPPGMTGRVALTMRLPCQHIPFTGGDPGDVGSFMVPPQSGDNGQPTVSVQGNSIGGQLDTALLGASGALAPLLTVTTPNGHRHTVVLNAPAAKPKSTSAITSLGRTVAPLTVRLRNSACVGLLDGGSMGFAVGELPRPDPQTNTRYPLLFHYDGIVTPATAANRQLTMRFTVTDAGPDPVDAQISSISTSSSLGLQSSVLFDPPTFHLAAGAARQLLVSYTNVCNQSFEFDPSLNAPLRMAAGGNTTELPLTSYLDGPSIQLSIDVATQAKAIC